MFIIRRSHGVHRNQSRFWLVALNVKDKNMKILKDIWKKQLFTPEWAKAKGVNHTGRY